MLSTLYESRKLCITRVTGCVLCMNQCEICGLRTRLFGGLQLHKDKAVSSLTW